MNLEDFVRLRSIFAGELFHNDPYSTIDILKIHQVSIGLSADKAHIESLHGWSIIISDFACRINAVPGYDRACDPPIFSCHEVSLSASRS